MNAAAPTLRIETHCDKPGTCALRKQPQCRGQNALSRERDYMIGDGRPTLHVIRRWHAGVLPKPSEQHWVRNDQVQARKQGRSKISRESDWQD